MPDEHYKWDHMKFSNNKEYKILSKGKCHLIRHGKSLD